MSQLTQPIKWHGGKHYLAKRIIELMPPHIHYVEPYFGGGSVLLQKDPEGVSEVVNDIDYELMQFWAVLRADEWFTEFKRCLEATPFAQPVWEYAGSETAAKFGQGTIARAMSFFVRARQSRQGLMKDFATLSRNRTRRGMNEQVSSWLTAIEGLPDIHARLKRVVILNDDAIKVIKQQDGPKTLFYCDPPYFHSTRVTTNDYKNEMSERAHAILLATLAWRSLGPMGREWFENLTGEEDFKEYTEALKQPLIGKFILSGYPSKMYSTFAVNLGWVRMDIKIDNKASSKKTKDIKTECLWMNFEPGGTA